MAPDNLKNLFIPVSISNPNINCKLAQSRHYVVLRAGFDNSHAHFYMTKHFRFFGEFKGAEPLDIFQNFINRIFAFIAGGVAGLTGRCTVKHHQAPFGNCQVHLGRFTNDCKFQVSKLRYNQFKPIVAGNFLFSGCCQANIKP